MVQSIAVAAISSIEQDGGRVKLHGAMSFVSLRLREVKLRPLGNLWSPISACFGHRALLKPRFLDSATSILVGKVQFVTGRGGG